MVGYSTIFAGLIAANAGYHRYLHSSLTDAVVSIIFVYNNMVSCISGAGNAVEVSGIVAIGTQRVAAIAKRCIQRK